MKVVLPNVQLIELVKIYLNVAFEIRKEMLVGKSVHIMEGDKPIKLCSTIGSEQWVYEIPCVGRGDTVKISVASDSIPYFRVWVIAEIQVFGPKTGTVANNR